jgi:hypothetical protein
MTTRTDIRIADVAWPAYKLIALAVGALVLLLVAAVTTTAATAVLAGSAAASVVWLALGFQRRSHR